MTEYPRITKAQAQAIADLIYSLTGGWITIDGPIASTGCIRVAWRKSIGDEGEPTYIKGVEYLDRKGKPIRWDSFHDRPRKTPSGRLIPA